MPRYSTRLKTTIRPYSTYHVDFKDITDFFNKLKKDTAGLEWVLSDRDKACLTSIVEQHVIKAPKEAVAPPDYDPTGLHDDERMKAASKRQEEIARILREDREREERVRAESNFIGEDGNPVVRVELAQAKMMSNLRPELHAEMTSDLKSVLENNLAVMSAGSSTRR